MRKAAYSTLAMFAALVASGPDAGASGTRQYGASSTKTTTLETSTGRRLIIATDSDGTVVKEERSGREVWRSIGDRHEAKTKEYVRTGAKVVPPSK